MRVLIINTSEKTGGAAVAANRLMEALNNNGVKAKMLVRDKLTDSLTVVGLDGRMRNKWNFLWERWCVFCRMRFSRKHLFEVDIANAGTDITGLREFKEADVIHLSWINQGMLSLGGIRKILESGKPVVWTMHDFWPATAICHYPRSCKAYASQGCANCQYLPGHGSRHDMAHRVWKRKERIWRAHNIIFVTCSRWLASAVKGSGLLAGKTVTSIPNPIDTREFRPADKTDALEMVMSDCPEGSSVVYVGDGINDAPSLARADIGIAMGGLGSDAAIEAADIVIMDDAPSKIPVCVSLSKRVNRIVLENIVFALAVKFAILALTLFGYTDMWAAVFGDVGVTVIAVLNAMRCMDASRLSQPATSMKPADASC